MDIRTPTTYLEPSELNGFKQITGQLMQNLQNNDIESAIRCINQINEINDQSICNIVGKITRGLHSAISDLNIPVDTSATASKNTTRPGLNYVIQITDDAAHKTLDMTEQTQNSLTRINSNMLQQQSLLDALKRSPAPAQMEAFLDNMGLLVSANQAAVHDINRNVTEIVIAQNFQDLASQSIRKAIGIINDVEASLVMLTQYTRILQQLSQYSGNPAELVENGTAELRNSLEKMDIGGDNEHMDQDDVDNLLSSLGF